MCECVCIGGGWLVDRMREERRGSTLLLTIEIGCIEVHAHTHKIRGMERYMR